MAGATRAHGNGLLGLLPVEVAVDLLLESPTLSAPNAMRALSSCKEWRQSAAAKRFLCRTYARLVPGYDGECSYEHLSEALLGRGLVAAVVSPWVDVSSVPTDLHLPTRLRQRTQLPEQQQHGQQQCGRQRDLQPLAQLRNAEPTALLPERCVALLLLEPRTTFAVMRDGELRVFGRAGRALGAWQLRKFGKGKGKGLTCAVLLGGELIVAGDDNGGVTVTSRNDPDAVRVVRTSGPAPIVALAPLPSRVGAVVIARADGRLEMLEVEAGGMDAEEDARARPAALFTDLALPCAPLRSAGSAQDGLARAVACVAVGTRPVCLVAPSADELHVFNLEAVLCTAGAVLGGRRSTGADERLLAQAVQPVAQAPGQQEQQQAELAQAPADTRASPARGQALIALVGAGEEAGCSSFLCVTASSTDLRLRWWALRIGGVDARASANRDVHAGLCACPLSAGPPPQVEARGAGVRALAGSKQLVVALHTDGGLSLWHALSRSVVQLIPPVANPRAGWSALAISADACTIALASMPAASGRLGSASAVHRLDLGPPAGAARDDSSFDSWQMGQQSATPKPASSKAPAIFAHKARGGRKNQRFLQHTNRSRPQ
jgi:hypothetical protein